MASVLSQGKEWAEQKARGVWVRSHSMSWWWWLDRLCRTVAQNRMLQKGLTAARISLQIHWAVLVARDDLGLQKG